MPDLNLDQKQYVKFRTLAKRRAAMTKPLHYQVAEDLFLITPYYPNKWRLVNTVDASTPTLVVDDYNLIEKILKEKIQTISKAFKAFNDAALKNKTLEEMLALEEIQYMLLKAEEALLPKSAEGQVVAKVVAANPQAQIEAVHQKAISSQAKAQQPVVLGSGIEPVSLILTKYNKHTIKLKTNGTIDLSTVMVGAKNHSVTDIDANSIFKEFEVQYRAMQTKRPWYAKIASVFRRDALDKASDPRPFYVRWLSKAPEETAGKKLERLLKHAQEDSESNTAKAFTAVLDERVEAVRQNAREAEQILFDNERNPAVLENERNLIAEAKRNAEQKPAADELQEKRAEIDCTDVTEVISKAESSAQYVWYEDNGKSRLVTPIEKIELEEMKARKSFETDFKEIIDIAAAAEKIDLPAVAEKKAIADQKAVSPTPSGSSFDSSAGIYSDSEPLSPPLSAQARSRSGSQDSGFSALVNSARSGSYPPSPLDSSSRARSSSEYLKKPLRDLKTGYARVLEPLEKFLIQMEAKNLSEHFFSNCVLRSSAGDNGFLFGKKILIQFASDDEFSSAIEKKATDAASGFFGGVNISQKEFIVHKQSKDFTLLKALYAELNHVFSIKVPEEDVSVKTYSEVGNKFNALLNFVNHYSDSTQISGEFKSLLQTLEGNIQKACEDWKSSKNLFLVERERLSASSSTLGTPSLSPKSF